MDSQLLELKASNRGIAGVCEEQSLEMDPQDGAAPLNEAALDTFHGGAKSECMNKDNKLGREFKPGSSAIQATSSSTQVRPLPVSGCGWKLRRDRSIPWRPSSVVGTQAKTVHSGAWRVIRGAVKAFKMELDAD